MSPTTPAIVQIVIFALKITVQMEIQFVVTRKGPSSLRIFTAYHDVNVYLNYVFMLQENVFITKKLSAVIRKMRTHNQTVENHSLQLFVLRSLSSESI